MPEKSKTNSLYKFFRPIRPYLVLFYLIIGLIAFAAFPILATRWMNSPFIGAFIEHTLVVSGSSPGQPGAWPLIELGKDFGNQLLSLNGEEIRDIHHLNELISEHSIGDQITLEYASPSGSTEVVETTLTRFPNIDRLYYFYIPYLIGLIYLGCGLWVFTLRRWDATGQAFAVFATSTALILAGLFEISTTNFLTYLWTIALGLTGGSLIGLAMLFPREDRAVIRLGWLRLLTYLVSIGLAAWGVSTIYNLNQPLAYVLPWRISYVYCAIGVLIFLIWTLVRYFKSTFPVVREQSRLILIGSSVAFGPIAIWFLVTSIWTQVHFIPYLTLPAVVFPVVIAYTILRYRILRTDYIFSRAIVFGVLMTLLTVGYALLVSGVMMVFGSEALIQNPLLVGLVIFLLALAFLPIRNYLQRIVEASFARREFAPREKLQNFGRELTSATDLPTILNMLRQTIQENMLPAHLHIYTYDALTDHYVAATTETDNSSKPTSDLRFAGDSALVKSLSSQRRSIFLGEARTLPTKLMADQTRIALLGSHLFVPLPGRQRLVGWAAMGQRQSGEPYNNRDQEFLEALCDQAALAIERAQVISDLERRVFAMNVLTRVSQGINVTLAFDDILELIYAQTNNILPTKDFHISLYDKNSDFLYSVFYLENDERLTEQENIPIPIGQGLEREVLSNRRALVTDDYERECRSRGKLTISKGLFSWVGVPLNTGAETIGVLSLASRDSTVYYPDEQVNFLQALADQAAGAIVKARLLQEAQRRTRQLTTLNEVSRSLTSTLELQPLLNQILSSAVDILNCEAGSLLLLEHTTGELIFEVAVGPVAADLHGKRLPPGAGLAGKAVELRQPLIENDVRRNKEWYADIQEETGFVTNDILVVPMLVKEQCLGAIEVINRKDGFPFTQDDQELLMAFTSQAGVALENARLYTQTDETLAARVEELSVMQRIDRELNASLDVSRAMNITLEWAMRQSIADAGLVGIKDLEGVRVMAHQGYNGELEAFPDHLIPIDNPVVKHSLESGQPKCLLFDAETIAENVDHPNILIDGQAQIIVPIRREVEVIGVVILENRTGTDCPEEILAFLSRLSDHAAIAISNAQLYAAVQAANLAKSDFVSFVSHELKTPMTSIRGFTDLLAAGVVGQVNEAQGNFLNTIRSNVDRMATLVSDLADVSRIEANRLRLDFQAVEVTDIVEDVVRSARAQIEEKQQELSLEVPADLPSLWGDRIRLIQVLTNLVNNAHKYTPQGGNIWLSAEMSDNQWDPQGARKVVHLSVKDSGIGISPENQKKIFQKFFRADDQKVRDIPGTGLGLNITKTLVEMQGGKIWFESEPEIGTTFHFTVPIVESA